MSCFGGSKVVGRGSQVACIARIGASVAVWGLGLAVPTAARAESVETPAPEANAPPLERAKVLHARGVAAFRDGNYEAAIDAFVAADRCVPSAALSFNIARAYERLDDTGQSLYWYSDYLRRVPDAQDAAQTRVLIAEREAKLARQGSQLLVVRTNPSGASLLLDGANACTSPCATVTTPGVHALSLSHEAHLPLEVQVEVGQARMTEVHFGLVPASDAEPAVASKPVPTVSSASVVAPEPRAPQAPATPRGSAQPARETQSVAPWPLVTLIAGGVGVGVAGGLELVRHYAESDVNAARVQLDKHAALDRMDQAMWGARIAGAVGGALLLTSGVLWWWDTPDTASAANVATGRPMLVPILSPWQAGLQLSIERDVW